MRPVSLQTPSDQGISWFRSAFIAGAAAVLGGVVALAMVGLMVWLCQRSWVVDDAASHGISEVQSSRLGGVAVFLGVIGFFLVFEWLGDIGVSPSSVIFSGKELPDYMIYVLLIAFVGLCDDFVSRVDPMLRLALVFVISLSAFSSGSVPMTESAYNWLPFDLNSSFALMIAGSVVVTGFVNAGNMADGANGLLCMVGISFLSVFASYGSTGYVSMLIMALLIFLVFNVSTGRIFLGDFWSYGLSAVIEFASLDLYASSTVSLWFLGSLLAYPCIEVVRVIVVRLVHGGSPFLASNDHLHNHLYGVLRKRGWNHILANSVTGCFLGFVSATIPASLMLFGVFDPGSTTIWAYCFAIYLVLHVFLAMQLQRVLDPQ